MRNETESKQNQNQNIAHSFDQSYTILYTIFVSASGLVLVGRASPVVPGSRRAELRPRLAVL